LGGGPLCTIKSGISGVWRMHVGNKGSGVFGWGQSRLCWRDFVESGRLEITRMKKGGWQIQE
jgi:hypothetical protein